MSRIITKPIAGLTVLIMVAIAVPPPSLAQQPVEAKLPPEQQLALALSQGGAYTLGAGDTVRVDIFNVPEYSGQYQVLIDGTLNLPLIGSIPVGGLTLPGASQLISSQYARFLRRPIVTVSLLTARSFQVAIAGEVSRPGSYTIPTTGGQFPTLTQVVQLAGGITQSANLRQVQIRRTQAGGRQQAINVNLSAIIQSGNLSQDVRLRDGDTIFIPTETSINPAEIRRNVASNLGTQAVGPFRVVVVGEVFRPGTHTVQGQSGAQGQSSGQGQNVSGQPPTLTQAIDAAGGLTASASITQIQLQRRTRTGTSQVIPINLLQLLQAGDSNQDLFLQAGDTIFVPTETAANPAQANLIANSNLGSRATTARIAVVGEVSRPGTYTVKGESTETTGSSGLPTLAQAIQEAGGATPLANIRQIQISRPTKSASPQVMAVNLLQLLQAGDLNQNVFLQDGDTVFIPTRTDTNPEEANVIASSTLRTQVTEPLKVAVVGEVTRPGTYTVQTEAAGEGGAATPARLTQAIQAAGGIKSSADVRQIQVRRTTRTGSERVIDVNLWQLLQEGDISQDILLQPGDTISIATASKIDPAEVAAIAEANFSPNTIRVNIVGEVVRSGPVEVQPNTALNQALLAAGGFNNRARQGSVELVRLNPNGTVTKRAVAVNFEQGINEQTNPTLRNNDVIVVGRSTLASVTDTLGTIVSPLGAVFSLFNFLRIFQ